MAADSKLAAMEAKVKFRSAAADILTIVEAVCRPGQSVEDLAGIIQQSISNDMLLDLLMEQMERHQQAKAAQTASQGKRPL